MVSAMQEQARSKQFDVLDKCFDFCEWVLSHPEQPNEDDTNLSDNSREPPGWHNSRRAVGDFVGACLEKEVNVPISARQALASLLDKLCTQYDRRLDDGEPVLLNRDDQLTEAINNTRSRALEDLVEFRLLVAAPIRRMKKRKHLKFLQSWKSDWVWNVSVP